MVHNQGGVFKVDSVNDEIENLIKASHQIKNKKNDIWVKVS